jgi:hypothetical protein
MFFQSTGWPDEMHVARSLFNDPLDKEPAAHVFFESHVSWLEVNDDLPKKVSTGSSASSASQPAPGGQPASGA